MMGIIGNSLMLIYISLVPFESAVKNMAMAFAMLCGLLLQYKSAVIIMTALLYFFPFLLLKNRLKVILS